MRDLHKIIKATTFPVVPFSKLIHSWLLQDLKMHLREDVPESGTNEDILDDFRNAIGNHLVAEMDPYDLEDRKACKPHAKRCDCDACVLFHLQAALHEMVLVCNVQYEEAEEMLEAALMQRAQVFAHDLVPTICDSETERAAIDAVRAECNCTSLMASDLIEQAIAGKFVEVEAKMAVRNFSCESIAMNKKRIGLFQHMMEWWAKERKRRGEVVQDGDQEDTRACGVNMTALTKTVDPTSQAKGLMESWMMTLIDDILPAETELKALTDSYDQVEQKWRIYLGLSVANEVGEHRMFGGSQALERRKKKQTQMLRADVRAELFDAFGDMLDAELTDPADKEEIHVLLQSLEKVEVETDAYVQRLEGNMRAIRDEEEAQVDSIQMNIQMQAEVMGKLDTLNDTLTDNLGRMRDMTGNGAALLRTLICAGVGVSIIITTYVYSQAMG